MNNYNLIWSPACVFQCRYVQICPLARRAHRTEHLVRFARRIESHLIFFSRRFHCIPTRNVCPECCTWKKLPTLICHRAFIFIIRWIFQCLNIDFDLTKFWNFFQTKFTFNLVEFMLFGGNFLFYLLSKIQMSYEYFICHYLIVSASYNSRSRRAFCAVRCSARYPFLLTKLCLLFVFIACSPLLFLC